MFAYLTLELLIPMIHEFGREHGKMSLIQSYQKYIISLKTL